VREHLSLCLSHEAASPDERQIKTQAAQMMLQLLTQTHPELSAQQRAAVIALACIAGTGAEAQWLQARQILAQTELTIVAAMRLGSATHAQAMRVGSWLNEQHAYQDALAVFALAEELGAEDAESQLGRAHAFLALGQPDHALQAADEALRLSPNHPWAELYTGDALQALGRLDEAHSHWSAVLALPESEARQEALNRLETQPTATATPASASAP
jgi:tetratricopeptide (TPR) repeat protein